MLFRRVKYAGFLVISISVGIFIWIWNSWLSLSRMLWMLSVYHHPVIYADGLRIFGARFWKTNMMLSLKQLAVYHLQGDWRSHGFGYLLFLGHPWHGVMVGLNSKASTSDHSSSFLSEIKGICRALHDVKMLVAGQALIVWTDSERTYLRISRQKSDDKKLLDVRISRLLAWIWENVSAG